MGAGRRGGGRAPFLRRFPARRRFHVAVNGQQAGPFDLAALQQQAAGGQLTRASLVWKAGMAQWAKAGEVPELAPLFAGVPAARPPRRLGDGTGRSSSRPAPRTRSSRPSPAPGCGAKLSFAPGTRELKCEYCGTANAIAENDARIEELDFDTYLKALEGKMEVQEAST